MKHFKHVHFAFNISEGCQISPVTPEVTSRNYEINETTALDRAGRNMVQQELDILTFYIHPEQDS